MYTKNVDIWYDKIQCSPQLTLDWVLLVAFSGHSGKDDSRKKPVKKTTGGGRQHFYYKQCDQIGRLFTYFVQLFTYFAQLFTYFVQLFAYFVQLFTYFGQICSNLISCPNFLATFFAVKCMPYFLAKTGWATLCATFSQTHIVQPVWQDWANFIRK
jgi:hypothetical protein